MKVCHDAAAKSGTIFCTQANSSDFRLTLVKPTRQFYRPKANLSTVNIAEGQQIPFYLPSMHDGSVHWQKRSLQLTEAETARRGTAGSLGYTDGYKSPTCSSPFPLWIHISKELKAVSNTYRYTLEAHPSDISTETIQLL